MKTVKITNKELAIQILRDAQKMISRGEELYVCYAIGECANSNSYGRYKIDSVYKAVDEITVWISSLLYPNVFLYSWLRMNHTRKFEHADLEKCDEKLRETRVAWIDWMISELEAVK